VTAAHHTDGAIAQASATPREGLGPFPQAVAVPTPEHAGQGPAGSAADPLAGGMRLQVAQTQSGQLVRIPVTSGVYQLPTAQGGVTLALPGTSGSRPPSGQETSGGATDSDGSRFAAVEGVAHSNTAAGAPHAHPHRTQRPGAVARPGLHEPVPPGAGASVSAPGESASHWTAASSPPSDSGGHTWSLQLPGHPSSSSAPGALLGPGDMVATYASAAAGAPSASTSQRDESQSSIGGSDAHTDMPRVLVHGVPSAQPLHAERMAARQQQQQQRQQQHQHQRRSSNPQMQSSWRANRTQGAMRRASSEAQQCVAEHSAASSVSAEDAPGSTGPAKSMAAGSVGGASPETSADGSNPAASGSGEAVTAMHVLSPSGSYHNLHLQDIQVLRPYLAPHQYVELRTSTGGGPPHAPGHAVPHAASAGMQSTPSTIYLSHAPGGEALHASMVRAHGQVAGSPVVVSTGAMPAGHLHVPHGQPPPTVYIPHPHNLSHPHPHPQPPQQGASTVGLPPVSQVLPAHALHTMPVQLQLQPHQQSLAQGIENTSGMYKVVHMPQRGQVFMVRT
jgi:hypothetical protein